MGTNSVAVLFAIQPLSLWEERLSLGRRGRPGEVRAAGLQPEKIRSLTVIEPPAFGLLRENPDVGQAVEHFQAAYAKSDPIEFYLAFTGQAGNEPRPNLDLSERELADIRTALLAVCDHLTAGLNAQRAIFDKAAHHPQIEMAMLFNLRLRAFLEDASAAAP